MNYYKRHLGDYAKDTGHLSPTEHGVYTLLMDWYYASETMIPAAKAYRIAKASTQADRNAVDAVLADFFRRDGDYWRHKRIDGEIEKFSEKSTKAKESIAKRWKKQDTKTSQTNNESDTNVSEAYTERNTTRAPVHQPLAIKEQEQERPSPAAPVDFKADLFARWKALPDGGGGAFLTKLFRDHKPEQRVMEAVERALDDTRANPKAFVVGVLNGKAKADDAYDELMRSVQ